MITFTSFKKSHLYAGEKFSVARYQPKGFRYQETSFLAAEDENGERIKLRNTEDSIAQYKKAFRRGCKVRWPEIEAWLKSLDAAKDYVLCCWCPYSQSSEKQLKDTGVFACHTGLIAQIIRKHRPDIQIAMDTDREKHLIKDWLVKSDAAPKFEPQPEPVKPMKAPEQAFKRVVFSKTLGEKIMVVKNDIAALIIKNPEGFAVYTEEEIALMKGKGSDVIKSVHNMKKIFGKSTMVVNIKPKEAR